MKYLPYKIRFLLSIGTLLFSLIVHAEKTDSLRNLIYKAPNDSIKITRQLALSKFYTNISSFDSAFIYVNAAVIQLKKQKKLYFLKYTAFTRLGIIHFYRGNLQTSLENYLIALGYSEKLGGQMAAAKAYENLAAVHYELRDYTKSTAYYLKSLAVYQEAKDSCGIVSALNNLADNYNTNKEPKKGILYLYEAIKYVKNCTQNLSANIYSNLAYGNYKLENYKEAEKYYLISMESYKNLGDILRVSMVGSELGEVYLETNQIQKAISYKLIALKQAQEVQSTGQLLDIYRSLALCYDKAGDPSKAFEYMKSFATLQDTFFTANSQRTLAEMQEKFDTEKKEKEILLLNKDKEIKAAEAKKQNLIIIFISIGLVLLAGLALIIYRSFKHSQKANKIISAQKKEVTDQKHLLQEKNTEILDSIHYAKRIQRALLTSNGYIKKGINKLNLDDSKSDFFILYKPKDIVSGDFYWALSKREKSINAQSFYLCTADCTGHGVPGAFMSLLGVSYLNEIIIEKGISSPDMVLNELRNSIIHALNPEQENSIDESVSENEKQIQDGMDAVLYKIESHDSGKKYLKYAAANNSFYVMRPNEENVYTIIDQKADKQPVGAFSEQKPFTLFEFEVFKNDIIISFTDGYADQFGGPKGKKIMYKKFEQLLISNAAKPMLNQKKQLDKLFMDWKANYEQIDDVLVIGVKI